MKKLINDPRHVVTEALEGLVRIYPGLTFLKEHKVVHRAPQAGEVAVISGGGAGHEPAHAGYVGPGLLTAAVSGDVFASPSTDAVLAAIRVVGSPAGVLLIVKNYTGDRLNFGLAAELARAEGIPCEMVIVADDLALSTGSDHAGRRGLAGTVLVHKVAGAAAAAGLDLAAVATEARRVTAALGTVGVGLSGCTVPGVETSGFSLADDEVELGLGIHGERGISRQPMQRSRELVSETLRRLVSGLALQRGDRIALLVNNLGGSPPAELLVVAGDALAYLDEAGIVVERCWSGPLLTALDMQGFSLSLLKVDGLLPWLDAEASAPAWTSGSGRMGTISTIRSANDGPSLAPAGRDHPLMRAVLSEVAAALQEAEPELTRLDQAVGDGDLGLSLHRGASAVIEDMVDYDLQRPPAVLEGVAATLRRVIGGTSGPLYAVLLLRAAATLRAQAGPLTIAACAEALDAGWRAISELGDAHPGDRTMLDALAPAAEALRQAAEDGSSTHAALGAAVAAAEAGADATRSMVARRGRSSYLADRLAEQPDPGAVAVAIWLRAIQTALTTGQL